ncbi:RrF2 family transcriptional regulator [Formosa algae]|uniref:Rrf2 family protein n=1 Tax=Formosa algae TaxID=225843 RepID=A0A9X1CCG6_9FLAO|nr:Rrf2 family transcriptional regulator [Formosa algae]MBP1840154.1 Rrf2 family protein [Formosa algae]MDQ0335754.1 Rrf2 family protein [Formosa algae]OEI79792.1 Rrf2 family transcriptional regulator [Formosa algae]PNW29743.1 transcriptional regulator [Formosa algae]
MFSKACEYGIRATVFIAVNSLKNQRVSPKEIAKEINSPEAFTAKILQKLAKNHVVNSIKGAHGGFEIDTVNMKNITLSDIIKAIDGDHIYEDCGTGLSECSDSNPCPMHARFKNVRRDLKFFLETTNLEDMALDITLGESILKR